MKKTNAGLAVIIQCRTSSTRLPGKALKLLGGKPVLEWTLNSMRKVCADRYIVATDEASYDELLPVVQRCGWELFAGPLEDVLERYCIVIRSIKCRTVLRATADNPFLFYEAAELLCTEFEKQSEISKCDYMTWTGLPHGSGVEIFRADSLLEAAAATTDPYDREHVGPALYNHKNKFTSLFFKAPSRFYFPEYRTTIDTPSDFRRALAVVNRLSDGKMPSEPYTTEQIVSAVKDPSVHDTVLFVPSVKKGCGTGHLRRCLKAAVDSGGFVYVPKDAGLEETEQVVSEYLSLEDGLKDYQIVRTFPEPNEFSLIVTDLFSMDKPLAEKLREVSVVAAIDEGSAFTSWCDYLLDIIPSDNENRAANLSLPAFIEKPVNRRTVGTFTVSKVLVTFGGEDPANLTVPAARYFAGAGYSVTAILPEKKRPSEPLENITFIEPVVNLKETLYRYDLVVTHYGLTAFEANSAGCAVILAATSMLHEKLSKSYGFCTLSRKQLELPFDAALFSDVSKLFPPCAASGVENRSLGDYIKNLAHGARFECPVCKNSGKTAEKEKSPEEPDEIVARTEFRTFRRCRSCGIIYMSWSIKSEAADYGKSYFSEQYKNQYGKTYLEDFEFIKKSCGRRVMELNSTLRIAHYAKPAVLDIGCAYGPFLSAANDKGWQVFGTDIAEDAVSYVQNTLLFPAVCAPFPEFDSAVSFGINQFDAVTMWYVIEHFSDLAPVLKKVSSLLKKGGIFAFSTPSGQGVSAKLNRQHFFEESPADHYTIWEPSRAGKILQQFGFQIVKTVSTGHHAERFPQVKAHGWEKTSLPFKMYQTASRLCRMGDTFEVYCRKVK